MKTNMKPYEWYKERCNTDETVDMYLTDIRQQVRDRMERIDEVHVTNDYVEFIGDYIEEGKHYESVRVHNNGMIEVR